ncbi:hypothetical protein ACQP04_29065 [Pseudonocardia halophobica]|uniref:hypothetical protein n=1 Tax=Pseudonocardia halophobica TaxID=29401 RepID=UPI003D9191FC
MLGPQGLDPAAPLAVAQHRGEVRPQLLPPLPAQLAAGHLRGEAAPEERLDAEDVADATAAAQTSRRVDEIAEELEAARQVEDALSEKLGRGEISLSAWEVGHKHAHARVVHLEAERDELAAQTAQEGPEFEVARAEELAADWDADEAANGTLRRAMLARALRGRYVEIEPRPHQKGKPVFDSSRVSILPAQNR